MGMNQNDMFDFSDFSNNNKPDISGDKRVKDFRKMKFEKIGSVPCEQPKSRAIFRTIDENKSG